MKIISNIFDHIINMIVNDNKPMKSKIIDYVLMGISLSIVMNNLIGWVIYFITIPILLIKLHYDLITNSQEDLKN